MLTVHGTTVHTAEIVEVGSGPHQHRLPLEAQVHSDRHSWIVSNYSFKSGSYAKVRSQNASSARSTFADKPVAEGGWLGVMPPWRIFVWGQKIPYEKGRFLTPLAGPRAERAGREGRSK